jgi:hydrogenase small subunit
MPGFPDRFSPFYKRPPGTFVSSNASRSYGAFVRTLRRITMEFQNRETRWDREEAVPSGWGNVPEPNVVHKAIHYFYEKLQFFDAEPPGRTKPEEMYPGDYEVQGVRAGDSARPGQLE